MASPSVQAWVRAGVCLLWVLLSAAAATHARAEGGPSTHGDAAEAATGGPATQTAADGASQAAAAADPPAQRGTFHAYESYVEAALREYRGHRFPEARSLFAKAHAAFPNARTLRGLAMVEFELRNYVESAALFERALNEPVRPLSGELRRETEQLRKKAEGFVAHFEIVSKSPVVIAVDGVQTEPSAGAQIALAVGDHVLDLSAIGYASQRRRLRVRGGEHETLEVTLTPLENSRDEAKPEPPRAAPPARTLLALQVEPRPLFARAPEGALRDDTRAFYKNRWLWTGVGVATAALAFGLGFGLTAHDGRTQTPISATPIAIRSGP